MRICPICKKPIKHPESFSCLPEYDFQEAHFDCAIREKSEEAEEEIKEIIKEL